MNTRSPLLPLFAILAVGVLVISCRSRINPLDPQFGAASTTPALTIDEAKLMVYYSTNYAASNASPASRPTNNLTPRTNLSGRQGPAYSTITIPANAKYIFFTNFAVVNKATAKSALQATQLKITLSVDNSGILRTRTFTNFAKTAVTVSNYSRTEIGDSQFKAQDTGLIATYPGPLWLAFDKTKTVGSIRVSFKLSGVLAEPVTATPAGSSSTNQNNYFITNLGFGLDGFKSSSGSAQNDTSSDVFSFEYNISMMRP